MPLSGDDFGVQAGECSMDGNWPEVDGVQRQELWRAKNSHNISTLAIHADDDDCLSSHSRCTVILTIRYLSAGGVAGKKVDHCIHPRELTPPPPLARFLGLTLRIIPWASETPTTLA